ncbi:MAG: transporter substrate-binding domain-containing protein [Halobacteriovoraceae bacterium]|nr:transporter substrate-binding domain-containing protein [Halobacteriovoraceae bacterium]
MLVKVIIFSLISFNIIAKTHIYCGGYTFPPFVYQGDSEHSVSHKIIDMMNQVQKKYEFIFVRTSSVGRYEALKNKRFDIMLFEDNKWGWKNEDVDSSNVFMKGGEVYIAKNKHNLSQSFFDDFSNKKMVLIDGYHYGFANYNADKDYLIKNFNAIFTNNHEGSIQFILLERGDIAVVTKSFLNLFLKKNPNATSKLIVSNKLDQKYHHKILVSKQGNISVDEINKILDKISKLPAFIELKKTLENN